MILEKSKNAKRNSLWGIISNIFSVLLPFAVRTVIIRELGSEYLGLNSLFTSILTVLNITELGFGNAIVYSMYKPLAEDNVELLCAILNYFRKIYRVIGSLIFGVGCCIIPFLHYLIHGDIPADINIYVLYLLYLGNTVISYWLFAYKTSILTIYQRNDIKSKVTIVLSTLMYLVQIYVLIFMHNYYIYVGVLLGYTVLNNIIPAIYVNKYYPQYSCKGKINKELKEDIKIKVSGLMITKIALVSRNAFDSIIVSALLGLTSVAIYNNYYYIINALTSLMLVLTTSIAAGVGNSIVTDVPDKNLTDMNIINFWYMWIAGWCTVCLGCLYQPFMHIWVGKSLMLPEHVMWMFAFYFLLMRVGDIQAQYFDAAGLWWYRRWYSIAEAMANMFLNLVLGYNFGIAGIIAATIITIIFINFLGSSSIIFKHYFKTGFREYLKGQFYYIGITAIVSFVTSRICNIISFENTTEDLWITVVIRAVICVIVPNVLFLAVYRKTKIFRTAFPWIKMRVKK